MSTPHDYYEYGPHDHRDPRLHNRGEGAPYAEPDWFANHHDGALPTLSTIGRGPKGDGVYAERDGADLKIKDELGEVVAQFSLGDWDIDIVPNPAHKIEEGQNSFFDVIVSNGVGTKTQRVIVPCGDHGTRFFIYTGNPIEQRPDNTYEIDKSLLKAYYSDETELPPSTHEPAPRVGDIVVLVTAIHEEEKVFLTYAPIVSLTKDEETPDVLVAVAHMYSPMTYTEVHNTYYGTDYTLLENKPVINGVTLDGSLGLDDLGIQNGASESSRFSIEWYEPAVSCIVNPETATMYIDYNCISLGGGYYIISGNGYLRPLTYDVEGGQDDIDKFLHTLGSAIYSVPLITVSDSESIPGENPKFYVIAALGGIVLNKENASVDGSHNDGNIISAIKWALGRSGGGVQDFVPVGNKDWHILFNNGGKAFFDAFFNTSTGHWDKLSVTGALLVDVTIVVKAN